MPPATVRRRRPPATEEDPAKPSENPPKSEETSAKEPEAKSYPWSPASAIADQQGLNGLFFGPPGCGKTTLITTIRKSTLGGPLLVVNFDEEVRSISDLDDVMVWPGEKQNGKVGSWEKASAFIGKLERGSHPFKSIAFDTLNGAYDFALKKVRSSGNPNRDGRQIYGEANDMVLDLVSTWAMISREQGINVMFTAHSREVQDGENGPIYVRPDITPGALRGIYQKVSTIGYLEPAKANRPSKLIMRNTARIVAKNHQPQSGPQIPNEIRKPDLSKIVDHLRHVKKMTSESEEDE